jgi:DNA polymerase III subunit epsilon
MSLNLDAPIAAVPLVFFDVETTGLNPRAGDRICELALLRCLGEDEQSFETLVNPQRALSASAAAVNGIGAAELALAPRFAEVAGPTLALLDGAILVAHNAGFDLLFLNSELQRLGLPPLAQPVLDTLAVARNLLRRSSYSLGSLARSYGLAAPTHRAMSDVRALRQVFAFLLEDLARLGVSTPRALLRYQRGLLPSDPEPRPPEIIALALSEQRRLRMRYNGSSAPAPTDREIDPIELVVERGTLCLRAFCYLRNDVRTFVIDRILAVELV